MTTEKFSFYLQNRLIQTSQTSGQRYSDTSPFSIPWIGYYNTLGWKGLPGAKTSFIRPIRKLRRKRNNDTRRNGQPPKSQLTKKSTC